MLENTHIHHSDEVPAHEVNNINQNYSELDAKEDDEIIDPKLEKTLQIDLPTDGEQTLENKVEISQTISPETIPIVEIEESNDSDTQKESTEEQLSSQNSPIIEGDKTEAKIEEGKVLEKSEEEKTLAKVDEEKTLAKAEESKTVVKVDQDETVVIVEEDKTVVKAEET